MKTVLICDTEPVAIEGLRSLLTPAHGLRVAAAETTLPEAMEAAEEIRPDLVLLDKSLGFQQVLEAVRTLRFAGHGTHVAVWGATLTDAEIVRLLHAGAVAAVRKTAPLSTLVACLKTAAEGHTWTESGMEARPAPLDLTMRSPLTAREVEVMALVKRGLTNKQIADELGIRTGTVKIHLKHIFEKTGIRGRYGLALSGLRVKDPLCAPELALV